MRLILTAIFLFSFSVHAKIHKYDPEMAGVCEQACSQKNYDEALIKNQGEAKVGDFVRCPVSGVVIKITETSKPILYNGKSIYTCCAGCSAKFLESPQKFAENLN